MMADRVKSNVSKTVLNPLLSGAGVGFPYDNFPGSSLLVPVPRFSPQQLVEDVGEVDTFVGQDTPAPDIAPTPPEVQPSESLPWVTPQKYTGLFSSFFGSSQPKEEPPAVNPPQQNQSIASTPRSYSPYVHVPNIQSFSPALFVPDDTSRETSVDSAVKETVGAEGNKNIIPDSQVPLSSGAFPVSAFSNLVSDIGNSNVLAQELPPSGPSPVEAAHSTSSSSDSIVADLQSRFADNVALSDSVSAEQFKQPDVKSTQVFDQTTPYGLFSPIQCTPFESDSSFPGGSSLLSTYPKSPQSNAFGVIGQVLPVDVEHEHTSLPDLKAQPPDDALQSVPLHDVNPGENSAVSRPSSLQSADEKKNYPSQPWTPLTSAVPEVRSILAPQAGLQQPLSAVAPLQQPFPGVPTLPPLTQPPAQPALAQHSVPGAKTYRLGSQKRLAYAPVPGLASAAPPPTLPAFPSNPLPSAPSALYNPAATQPTPLQVSSDQQYCPTSTAHPPPAFVASSSFASRPPTNSVPVFSGLSADEKATSPSQSEVVPASINSNETSRFLPGEQLGGPPMSSAPALSSRPESAGLSSAVFPPVPISSTYLPTSPPLQSSSTPSFDQPPQSSPITSQQEETSVSTLFSSAASQAAPWANPPTSSESVPLFSVPVASPPVASAGPPLPWGSKPVPPLNPSFDKPPQSVPITSPVLSQKESESGSAKLITVAYPAAPWSNPPPSSESVALFSGSGDPSLPWASNPAPPPISSSDKPPQSFPITSQVSTQPENASILPKLSSAASQSTPWANPSNSSESVPLFSVPAASPPLASGVSSLPWASSSVPPPDPPSFFNPSNVAPPLSNPSTLAHTSGLFRGESPGFTMMPTSPGSSEPRLGAPSNVTPTQPPEQLNTVDLSAPQSPGRSSSPSVVPPRLLNLGQSGLIYRPPYYHWFFKKEVEGKEIWEPFSMSDSFEIEQAFNSAALTMDTVVPTDGGRYDVYVVGRKRESVYWHEAGKEVRRCSWFHKSNAETQFKPYDENTAYILEEEYKMAVTTASWNRRVQLNDGEYVVLYGPSSMAHYQSTILPDDGWDAATDLAQQSQQRPRVVKRGVDDFDIDDGETSDIDHILFVVHGIGSVCDLKMRTIEEAVEDFRTISNQLVKTHYQTSMDAGEVSRIEVLPVSWHHNLHGETGVDSKLSKITLKSIPKLRHFTNDTLLDILFYTSPVFCQNIMQQVGQELNKQYDLFLQRNPNFRGGVSVAGHSLGSLILFDMLCHQKRPDDKSEPSSSEKEKSQLTRTASYVMGTAGTGQPFITYPQLNFQPNSFFALGSPIGMFVTVRGIESLGQDFRLPTCPGFYNIFHPYDPVAYRIEALINPALSDVRPVLIPHHKGRKRMHLELRETMARVGADLKQRLMDSVRSTWNTVYHLTTFGRSEDLEQEVDQAIASQMGRARAESTCAEEEESDTPSAGVVNQGRRVDYVLQEAPLESFNEYVSAITSHVCYWDSEDTVLFILKDIYNNMGITADSPASIAAASEDHAASPQVPYTPPTPTSSATAPLNPTSFATAPPGVMGMDPTAPMRAPSGLPPPPMSGFSRK